MDRTPRIREKNGTKRSLLVDEHGVPLSLVVTGANRHDSISLEPLLKGRIFEPKDGSTPLNLCLDAAYIGKEDVVTSNGFVPHIRPRGEVKKLIERDPTFKARRWIVELAHSWFNRFRKLVPRYEK
ncbi:MAG: transposase, partial [Proteobacteria bacterium]|nr:transposase [Pseudomonadota bacterium]